MPLPPNCSISLQGHSRLGEATTMPKIAMVVRMTEQALDALQNLSGADRVDFEFGDKPGIYVRDQFFSMRYDKERENQELFIRTTLPNRPNAPLRLNANVLGKFAVEQLLNEKISQRLHNATAAAAKQKAKPKAILVDSPITSPLSQAAASKKKGPPKSTPRSTPTIVKSYATPVLSQAATASASSSASLPTELATMYRQRLVHYLALGPATVPDIFKEFGGSEIDHNIRAGIMDILIEIAEQEQLSKKVTSAPQVTNWRLKPRAWLEARPYQYSGYTENVRTKVARMARQYLSALKIPENDPAWDHVKYRDGGHGNTASNAHAAQRAINGTTTAVAKAKIQKAKDAKLKGQVKAKSEVATASRSSNVSTSLPSRPNPSPERSATPTRSIKGKERATDSEKEEGELSASQTPPSISSTPAERRPPNSRPNGTSAMPPPPVPMSSQPSGSSRPSSSASSKRSGPVDARGPRRPPPEPSQPTRAAPPIPPPASVDRKPVVTTKIVQQQKKERAVLPSGENSVGAPAGSSQSAKERVVVKKERERERESDRESIRMSRKERERESDRESIRGREREKVAKEKDLAREKPKEKVKEQASTTRPVAKSTKRRKASEYSDEESSDWGYEDRASLRKSAVSKIKREQDSTAVKSSSSSPSLRIPRWESPSLKQKIKRDPSPLPSTKTKPSMERKVVSTSSVPQAVKKEPRTESLMRSSTTKAPKRRRSIDFTSSSEEEEEKPKLKTSKSAAKAGSSSASKHPLPSKSRSRPTREDLRIRYSTLYTEYLTVLQKLVAQKNMVQNILRRGSESPNGDSDVDADIMPLDELEELTKRHQRLYDELEEIKKKYMA